MRVKATCKVWYAGKERQPDEEFEIEPNDETNGKILVGVGKAVEVKSEEPVKVESKQLERQSQPEPAPEAVPEPVSTTPKRRYPRRDMRAEE